MCHERLQGQCTSPFGQRPGGDAHIPLGEERGRQQAFRHIAVGCEGHADFALLHPADQAGALDVGDLHPDPRRRAAQLANQVADDDALRMVRGGDAQGAFDVPQRDRRRHRHRVDQRQQLSDMRLYQLAIGCRHHAVAGAHEQGIAKNLPDPLELQAHGLLRNVERLGHRRHGPLLIERAEHPQMVEFQLLDHERPKLVG